MPTVIHRYKISTTAETAQRPIVNKRFANIFATLPGVTVTFPMIENQYAFAVCFSLNGIAEKQICFFSMGKLTLPELNGIGVCEYGYTPRLVNQVAYPPRIYWRMYPDTIGDEQNFEMVFAVKDGRVIGIAQRIGGFCLFHYTADGVKCVRQDVCYSEFGGQQCTARISIYIPVEGINGIFDAGKYTYVENGYSEARMISANVDNYTLPTGKMLKLSNIWLDNLGAVSGIPTDDYPAIMIGDGVKYSNQNCPTYKTIQIDGQKYIHFGSNSWLPYDSIVVHTEAV